MLNTMWDDRDTCLAGSQTRPWGAAGLIAIALGAAGLAEPVSAADLPPPVSAAPGFLAPAPLPFFVRLGVTAVLPDTDISAKIAGAPVAGGNGSIGDVPAAYVEAGYYLTHAVAVSISAGYPPTFTTRGTGTLAPLGTLYKAEVGLPVLQLTYHLDGLGPFRPYAGVGFGYAVVFRNEAGTITQPNLRDAASFVLVGGIDYDLTAQWGVFVDVKKAFVTQRFTGIAPAIPGVAPPLPTSARVTSDPLLVTAGLSYRF